MKNKDTKILLAISTLFALTGCATKYDKLTNKQKEEYKEVLVDVENPLSVTGANYEGLIEGKINIIGLSMDFAGSFEFLNCGTDDFEINVEANINMIPFKANLKDSVFTIYDFEFNVAGNNIFTIEGTSFEVSKDKIEKITNVSNIDFFEYLAVDKSNFDGKTRETSKANNEVLLQISLVNLLTYYGVNTTGLDIADNIVNELYAGPILNEDNCLEGLSVIAGINYILSFTVELRFELI